jgi:hypothetical protein
MCALDGLYMPSYICNTYVIIIPQVRLVRLISHRRESRKLGGRDDALHPQSKCRELSGQH